MSSMEYDITIIGGGMVGLALASALASVGARVGVVEKDDPDAQLAPSFDGRVSAISLGSQRVLEAVGAWQHMREEAEPILDIRVVEGYGTAHAHYNYKDVGEEPVGHMVENRHIRTGLLRAAREKKNLELITRAEVAKLERDAYATRVTLADGRTIAAPLLVAADGKRSRIREQAGIAVQQASYGQTAIVCCIDHSRSHEGLALERFLPAGPFAVLPMCGGMRSAVVWSEREDEAGAMLALSDEAMIAELTRRTGDYLGTITKVGRRFSYPLTLVLAKTYIGERLALVGDAAHAIHPVAGQGVNVGFRDVAVLAELVEDALSLGLDLGAPSLLAHYQRWRRFDAVSMGAVTDGITRLFSNDVTPLRAGRGLGLRMVNQLPPLKRLFMRHAMGLLGDLPRMMQERKSA